MRSKNKQEVACADLSMGAEAIVPYGQDRSKFMASCKAGHIFKVNVAALHGFYLMSFMK